MTLVLGAGVAALLGLGTRVRPGVVSVGALVALLLYAGPLLVLVTAAHKGGRLVHEIGVLSAGTSRPVAAGVSAGHGNDD